MKRPLCFIFIFLLASAVAQELVKELICKDHDCNNIAIGPIELPSGKCITFPYSLSTSSLLITALLQSSSSFEQTLSLCFFPSSGKCQGTAEGYSGFLNGTTASCPFLGTTGDSELFVKFIWNQQQCSDNGVATFSKENQRRRGRQINLVSDVVDYGRWCGPGHGGTNDCCSTDGMAPLSDTDNDDGIRCTMCNPESSANVTTECLMQCPPVDSLDLACAIHDYCSFDLDYTRISLNSSFSCTTTGVGLIQAQNCICDCRLIKAVQNFLSNSSTAISLETRLYANALVFYFTHLASCWYYDALSGLPNCKRPTENPVVTEFC